MSPSADLDLENDAPLDLRLVCPRDRKPLRRFEGRLACSEGHSYRIVDGIPILLRGDVEHAHWAANRSLESSESTLLVERWNGSMGVHPFVQKAIGATNGYMYQGMTGKLTGYPIPEFPRKHRREGLLLDIGCNWGRWCVAAARAGFLAIGIDPSFEAVHAARHIARQLGVRARFLVAESRHLPFEDATFEVVFSYSVLQHLPRSDVRSTLAEVSRVLKPEGTALVQMPNRLGLRSLYHQARRGFREGRSFEVRYWSVKDLRRTFEAIVGPSEIEVDGFFSLNSQSSDARILPLRYRLVVRISERLRRWSEALGPLKRIADSLYVVSRKRAPRDFGAASRTGTRELPGKA